MGAYLSQPIIDKLSCDEKSLERKLSFGASSMQGWRVTQEDAHNCVLEYDKDTSLFAVYDGHGGHEVAAYCAENLPDFLKNLDSYKQGDISKALEEVYLEFDQHLTKEDVIKTLHAIAGNKSKEAPSEEDPDEMSDLYEEATMSIEELISRYGKRIKESVGEQGCEGNSKGLQSVMSKICASKARKSKKISESASRETNEKKESICENLDEIKTAGGEETQKCSEADGKSAENSKSDATENEKSPTPTTVADKELSNVKEENRILESSGEYNGKLQNGANNHDSENTKPSSVPAVVGKGKGIGKGLSNSIRKAVERTPEEVEKDRLEAEKMAKRKERKESLRNKSADELYKSMVSTDENEDSDDDGDDEEDEDFDGETSSSDDVNAEDDEDDWEDEDEEEEEEDEEVAAKAKSFSMNLKEEPGSDSGCTAVLALLRGKTLYVANAGDSRCVLSRQGRAIPLTADHKPEDEPEKSRIEKAGGVVTADGRVNGGLNLSRAIGDHAYKQNTELGPREQMITALPDVQSIDLEPGDDFFILACDGIWNSKSNQQVIDFVRPRLAESKTLAQICEELFDECLAPDTLGDGTGCDNMTAIIVRLDHYLPSDDVSGSPCDGSHPQKRPLPHDSSPNDTSADAEGRSMETKRQRMDEQLPTESLTCGKEPASS